jgi:iron complex transport system ATP-binding protein
MLVADRVSFAYDRGAVLDEVSLTVDRGSIVGVLGPNGSGKTTLLRVLAGTADPRGGVVSLDGRSLRTLGRRDVARRLAVVPQDTHPAFAYTVLEMVLMGRYPWLGPFEIEGPDDLAAARDALEATGMAGFASRPFTSLSGGERQRVVISAALAQIDPRGHPGADAVLLLDEPTTALDLRYQLEVAALIRRLHEQRRVTVVVSTHDLRLVASVCSHLLLLSAGRVQAFGPTASVLTPDRLANLFGIDRSLVPMVHV